MAAGYRVGIDIGGTFTDTVLIAEQTGEISIGKVPTTPSDPSGGFLQGLTEVVGGQAVQPHELHYVIHATTVATNALLERRGARSGLLVTRGFRDILEIGRQVRHELYNLQTDKPAPLIPRSRCLEVPERLDHRGEVLVELDEAAVEAAVEALRAEQIESLAICLLHAYRNPVHERRVAQIVGRLWPELPLSLSSEVAPEIREYWRASTTVTNAYVAPVVSRYLERIEEGLAGLGVDGPLHIVQSSGGTMSAKIAKVSPVQMLESGPASGVSAAAFVARVAGIDDAISFDMGGTTAKAGLIRGGRPMVLPEFEAGGHAGTGGVGKGSGFPILGAVMDLVEVSAGGGSIAWVDAGGLLRVGPRSAGADPGPTCYAKGGTLPTVTDANLVLGRLNPDYFLGGRMRLDVAGARAAIKEHCADPLGMDVDDAAMGIVDIADAAMVQSMRLVSIARGLDPRDFALVAFGGAGPVHANRLAAELRMPTVVIPPSPGVASALGMLVTDLRQDYRATSIQPLADADLDGIAALLVGFEADARDAMASEGLAADQILLAPYVDVRYVGQSFRLTVELPSTSPTEADVVEVRSRFDALHEQLYGYAVPTEPVEIVNAGLSVTGVIVKPQLPDVPAGDGSPQRALRGTRPVLFADEGFVECCVYDRYALRRGDVLQGPAIVEEMDSSTVIRPDYRGELAEHGTLILRAMSNG